MSVPLPRRPGEEPEPCPFRIWRPEPEDSPDESPGQGMGGRSPAPAEELAPGGSDPPKHPADGLKFQRYYEEWVKPLLFAGKTRRGIEEYDEVARLFVEIAGDLDLRAVTTGTLADFCTAYSRRTVARGRRKGQPILVNTVLKQARKLEVLLGFAGPASRENKRGFGLLDQVPWCPPLERVTEETPEEDAWTQEEFPILLKACSAARAPRAFPFGPVAWWRGVFAWFYNTGTRIWETVHVEWSMIRPDREGDGWLAHLPATIRKGGKRGKFIVVNQAAYAAASAIRTDDPRLFPWDYGRSYLHAELRRIVAASDLADDRKHGRSHWFRKGLATDMAEESPDAAQKQLGHAAGSRVTLDSYERLKIAKKVLKKRPQGDDPQQRTLFD